MSEWLQVLAAVLTIVAGLLRRAESRVVSILESASATSSTESISLPPMNRLERWQIDRLKSYGAVVGVGNDLFFLDSSTYKSFRAGRRRRIAVGVPVLLATILVLWWVSQ